MAQDFFQVVEDHARVRPEDIAYIFMGQETTWKQYRDNVNSIANSLLELGLEAGDRIALALPQSRPS